MSRRFNFMPSRYVTDPSRHVTPSHADGSLRERNEGVTGGGQPADATRTNGEVTRDNPVTYARLTREHPVSDAEREAAAERRAEAQSRDYEHRRLIEGLGSLRLMGRHADRAMGPADLDYFFKGYGVPADKGRAAYEAGRRDRAQGMRCLCASCGGMRASFAERARQEFRIQRQRELQAEGVPAEDIARRIEMAISRGEGY